MTGPRGDRQVEQALTSWMDREAPSQAPTRLLEDTFAETMKTRQVRVYPWHRTVLGRRSGLAGSPAIALLVIGALLGLLLGVAVAGGSVRWPSSPTAAPTPTASAVATRTASDALPAAISITPDATVPVPDLLGWEVDTTRLWGLVPGSVDRIDLATGKITGAVPVGLPTNLWNGFARNDAGLWATEWESATLYRVDPKTLKVVATIPAGFAPKGVLANADGVWVADTHDGKVLRVDPVTNTIAATIDVGPSGSSGPNWLASGLGSVWVDIPNNGTVVRIDPTTDTIQATLPTPKGFVPCGGMAIGTDAVWVSGCDASAAVGRFDPLTNAPVTAIAIPGHGGPTLIGDAPWISVETGDPEAGLLVRIDPATNTIDRVLVPDVPFGGGGGVAVVAGSVWVHDYAHGVLLRFPLAAFGA
ncbi:MAG TPA: hypothetical protein VHR16_00430 [Candidatus Limnocylindrales bacterium]|nr:hypothetical protein [Candidatus Limnocylindrales bacterium]